VVRDGVEMNRVWSLFLLAVLCSIPSVARAQSYAPPPPSDGALMGSWSGSGSSRRSQDDTRYWATVGTNIGIMAFSTAMAAIPPLTGSWASAGLPDEFKTAVIITGTVIGVVLPPIAVTLVGGALGGRGTLAMAIGGHAAGLLVPVVGPFIASAVGYDFSHREVVARDGYRSAPVGITLGLGPQGLILGGRF
jgi:hypothetical protein